MSNNQLCVIVPIYKEQISDNEYQSIVRVNQVFREDKKFFILPEGMNYSYYQQQFPSFYFAFFDKRYFMNTITYSRLLLTPMFYRCFIRYEYMLISQTDSLLMNTDRGEFDYYMNQNIDYWGAVWKPALILYRYYGRGIRKLPDIITKPRLCKVGNGGFSLRRISSCLTLLESHKVLSYLWGWCGNEDCFFAYQGQDQKNNFILAPAELAERFASEGDMKLSDEDGQRVYAVHAWEKNFDSIEALSSCYYKGRKS